MKKKFLIAVDIDTEADGNSQSAICPDDAQLAVVDVRKESISAFNADPVAVLCHELGHVVAKMVVADGPNAKQDKLSHELVGQYCAAAGSEKRKLLREHRHSELAIDAEREAWDLAAKIYPDDPNSPLFTETRWEALQSYEAARDAMQIEEQIRELLKGMIQRRADTLPPPASVESVESVQ